MYLRLLSSVCLLACLVSAGPVTLPGPNEAKFLLEGSDAGGSSKVKYTGVFIYKNGEAKKLLDDATSISIYYDPHAFAYIGNPKGIFFYDDSTEKLEKYGTIDDSIADVRKSHNSDTLFIRTQDDKVYKVTEEGTKKTKIDGADGAIRIELDWDDNLYFLGADKSLYVVAADGVKKIQGLPPLETNVDLLFKALPEIEHGLSLGWNDAVYYVFPDGTSRLHEVSAEEKAINDENQREIYKFIESIRKLENDD